MERCWLDRSRSSFGQDRFNMHNGIFDTDGMLRTEWKVVYKFWYRLKRKKSRGVSSGSSGRLGTTSHAGCCDGRHEERKVCNCSRHDCSRSQQINPCTWWWSWHTGHAHGHVTRGWSSLLRLGGFWKPVLDGEDDSDPADHPGSSNVLVWTRPCQALRIHLVFLTCF